MSRSTPLTESAAKFLPLHQPENQTMKTQPAHHSASMLRAVLLGALCLATELAAQSPPVITDVTAAQQPLPSKLVNISYTISDPDSSSVNISIFVSKDSGATWTVPALTFTGTGAPGNNIAVTSTPTAKTVVWNAGADWNGHFTANCRVRVMANDNGLVGIPAGTYLRGTAPALNDTDITDAPQFPVTISAFWIDSKEVTGSLWNQVKEGYADSHGYVFDNVGTFKAPSHPVHTINWYDAVKWCNARSEKEGRTPVYYTDTGFTTIYKTGQTIPFVNTAANGYRLPTEAEWEKSARGGLSGKRFPWGDTNNISQSKANYTAAPEGFSPIDLGPMGPNLVGVTGGSPYTSPAGSFPANDYGLFDMAGNITEWCWDWYGDTYYAPGQTNPQGAVTPGPDLLRVARGGSWYLGFTSARCANRKFESQDFETNHIGFRVALSPGAP
jgi:formylglycine-generating enzyme required for sulfatase activity